MLGIVRAWLATASKAAFERWAEHVEEEMEMKQKLKRAAMKLGRGTGGVVGVLLAASDDRQRPLLLPRARRRQHRLTPGPRGVSQSHKRRRHCHNYLFVLQILLVKHVHNHRIEHAHIRQHNHKHQVHPKTVLRERGFRLGFVHHCPRPRGSGLYHYALILYHLTTARGLGSGARSVSESCTPNLNLQYKTRSKRPS